MGRVGEITVIVKFPPKREKMLGSLIESVEGVEEEETVNNKRESLDKLCTHYIYINYQRTERSEQGVFKRSSLITAAYNSCGKNVLQKP